MYRKKSRKLQYIKNIFDDDTRKELDIFMKENNMNTYDEIWLNNIKEILKSDYNHIKYNNKIFSYIRWEFNNIKDFNFVCIWEAEDNSEFIITTKCFGIYESNLGNISHYFYVISPKHILVLTNNIEYASQKRNIGMFSSHIHEMPKINYKNKIIEKIKLINNPYIKDYIEPYLEKDDIFNIKIKKVDKKVIYLINSIFLEEEDESITFVSNNNLYESIVFYENCKELILQRNYNELKSILKINNIYETNFNENTSFPYDEYIDKGDLIKLFKYNNSYFLEMLIKQTKILNEKEKQNILENGYPIEFLPDKLQLKEGIIIKCKEMVELYLFQMNQIKHLYTNYDIKIINSELLNIPLVNIILKHNIDNNNENIINLNKILNI